jgi:putative colanic acid biosynthesis acetyltransferase WcaF
MTRARILPVEPSKDFGRSASFTLGNRAFRLLWTLSWNLLARWLPGWTSPWRVLLLNLFGARVARAAAIASGVRVWLPAHLELGPGSTLGPGVNCYNLAPIVIGSRTVISQGAHLCSGGHDIADPGFQLVARPITIGNDVWIAASAFVGPGVAISDGCVLGAHACAFEDLNAWTVYRGNPATAFKARRWRPPNPHEPGAS